MDAEKCAAGRSYLNQPPASPLAGSFDPAGACDDACRGFYAEIKNAVLDTFSIDVEKFSGRIVFNGRSVPDQRSLSEEDVQALLGAPYWRDEDDDEIILFYENNGLETQFEFSGKRRMSHLIFTRQPLMADNEQRRLYGVTKPWPP